MYNPYAPVTDREQVKAICLDVFREMLFEHEAIKLELESLKNGTRVMLPTSNEHAKMMLIIAMNYLGIKPGQPISYGDTDESK